MLLGAPIQTILYTVFQSIFQVFLLCLAGFLLSLNGIVDKPISKALNHLNIALFTPALLFSKVAFFLSPAKLRQLWIIPIFFTVLTGLSGLVAYLLARLFRLKRSQANFATAASMFMNSNSLPVALMQSLATTVPLLKWGPDDTVDAMFGRSLTYLVVFSTLGMILRWSYGIHLLTQADEPDPLTPVITTYHDADDTDEHPGFTPVAVDTHAATRLVDYETEPDIDGDDQHHWCTRHPRSRPLHPRLTALSRHTRPHAHLRSHLPAVPTSPGDQSESEDTDDTTGGESEDTIVRPEATDTGFSTEAEDAPPASSSSGAHPVPRWDPHAQPASVLARVCTRLTSLSPPLVASLLALAVVLVPPLQRVLQSQAMVPFKGALDNAGACSIPLTLIVLGGWFWDGNAKPTPTPAAQVTLAKGTSRSIAKHKGTGRLPSPDADGQGHPDPAAPPRQGHHVMNHANGSTASLSSLLGTFGDVLMARVPLRGSARSRRRDRGSALYTHTDDVERGPLATHAETADARPGSRSRTDPAPANGRTRPSLAARGTHAPGETLTVCLTLLARMVLVPALVTPLMVLASRLGWGGDVFEDPVFVVSSMLLIASPPALTLAQISQRAKGFTGSAETDAFSPFERLLSRTVFWAYLVLTPPVTIASVMVGLVLVGA